MTIRMLVLLAVVATTLSCSRSSTEDELTAKLEDIERRLEEGRRLERNLPALEAEIADVSATVEQLGAVLVADEGEAQERLRTALETSGFGVVDLRSRGSSTVEGVRVLRFDVEAVVPFDATSRAFESLELRPLLVVVEDLSMKRDGERARLAFTAQLGLASQAP